MKRIVPIFLLLISLTACNSEATSGREGNESSTSPPGETDSASPLNIDPFELPWEDRSIFTSNLVTSEQDILDNSDDFTTYHIDVEISEDLTNLSGRQEVLYTNQEQDVLTEIYFRLFPNIVGGSAVVTSLMVDEDEVEPMYEFADSAIRVPLPTPLDPGDSITLSMNFGIEIPTEMGGNYGLYGFFEDVLLLDEFYPTIPVYNDEGWNVEIPPQHGDFPNNDAAYYVVRIKAPKALTIVASGVVVSEIDEGNKQVRTYAAGPARDFYIAASDAFQVVQDIVGETTINSYSFKHDKEGAELALTHVRNSLISFGDRFGTYPYTELDVVSTPMVALGMEYPGVMTITLIIYDVDSDFRGTPNPVYLESVVVHEVGHQWFYNAVGNDQIDEPWLDEAIVQYITRLYYFDLYGQSGYLGYRQSWVDRWARVENAEIPIGLPAGDYTGVEYGAIVYGRGPLFVEVLADRMGQSTFDDFLRDYYQTYKWGRVTTGLFQEMAEQYCNCDLSDSFNAWVYGE